MLQLGVTYCASCWRLECNQTCISVTVYFLYIYYIGTLRRSRPPVADPIPHLLGWALRNAAHCNIRWVLRNVPTVVYKKYTVTEIHVWNHSWRLQMNSLCSQVCCGSAVASAENRSTGRITHRLTRKIREPTHTSNYHFPKQSFENADEHSKSATRRSRA